MRTRSDSLVVWIFYGLGVVQIWRRLILLIFRVQERQAVSPEPRLYPNRSCIARSAWIIYAPSLRVGDRGAEACLPAAG